jgi:hypothetical protein
LKILAFLGFMIGFWQILIIFDIKERQNNENITMRTNRIFTTLTFIFLFSQSLPAQVDSNHYDIKIVIKGLKKTKVGLGYYYGDVAYLIDSSAVDASTGFMRFNRRKKIPDGLYFVAYTEGGKILGLGSPIFEFIVNGWKDFTIKTDLNCPIECVEVIRSDENTFYFNYLKSARKIEKELAQLTTPVKTISDEDVKIFYRKRQSLSHLRNQYIQKYANLFFAQMLKSNLPTFQNNIKQYWDNFDFVDSRLLRSRVYINRLQQFALDITPQSSDDTQRHCDNLLARTKVNIQYYQFTLKWLTDYFASKMPSPKANSIFVYLVEIIKLNCVEPQNRMDCIKPYFIVQIIIRTTS